MQALLSILPDPFYTEIDEIWDQLENKFGVKFIRDSVPFPHFTWNVAEEYLIKDKLEYFRQSFKKIDSFVIKTSGIGLFTGSKKVLYIPIKPTKELFEYHKYVWELSNINDTQLNEYYSPENWFPHITLAVEDIETENVGEIVKFLADKKFKYDIKIDSISFVYREVGKQLKIERSYGLEY
ncbi:MAG: 2'-5' RNA ligase family protein [Thermotogota bacterium]